MWKFIWLLQCVFLLRRATCQSMSEPACSKFDYEEKLLAKTIRLEIAVENLSKRLEVVEVAQETCEVQLNNKEKENEGAEKAVHPKQACPKPYKYKQDLNLCWYVPKGTKVNAFDAEERCEEDGAELMILNNTDLISFMQEWLKAAGVGDVFVGATDVMKEGVFKWNNGETVGNIPWGTGEPNGGTGSNCLVMHVAYSFKFCDRECSAKHEFICQIRL